MECKGTQRRKATVEIQNEWMVALPWTLTNLGFHRLLGNQKHNQYMQLLYLESLLSLLDLFLPSWYQRPHW